MFRPDSEPLLPNWRHLPVGYHGRAGHGRRQRHAGPAAAGPGQAAGRGRPRVRPVSSARHRARARLRRRDAEPPRRARPDRRFRRPRLRRRPRQRLERPRHPGVGVRAARPLPRQELRHVDLGLGDAARAARRSPRRGSAAGSGAAAAPPRRRRLGPRHPARGGAERRQSISRGNGAALYWTMPQQLAHATSNGASVRTGDLMASGTISGARARQRRVPDRADAERRRAAPPRATGASGRSSRTATRSCSAASRSARCAAASSRRVTWRSASAALRHPGRAAHPPAPQRPGVAAATCGRSGRLGRAGRRRSCAAFERRLGTRTWLLRQLRFGEDEERCIEACRAGWRPALAPARARALGGPGRPRRAPAERRGAAQLLEGYLDALERDDVPAGAAAVGAARLARRRPRVARARGSTARPLR